MSWENELFHFGGVMVTDKRFSVRQRSFPLQNISGVEVVYQHRTWMPVLSALAAAASFELAAIATTKANLHMGALLLLALTATLFWMGGPRYTIELDTRSGYIRPLTSGDRFFVESVSHVLQSAMQSAEGDVLSPTHPIKIAAAPAFRLLPGKAQRAASAATSKPESNTVPVYAVPLMIVRKPSKAVGQPGHAANGYNPFGQRTSHARFSNTKISHSQFRHLKVNAGSVRAQANQHAVV